VRADGIRRLESPKAYESVPAARSAATAVSGRGPHPHYGAGRDRTSVSSRSCQLFLHSLLGHGATVAGYDTPRTDGMQGQLSGGRPELGNHICWGLTRSPPELDGTWSPGPFNSAEPRARLD
jgi:hypothetical protein